MKTIRVIASAALALGAMIWATAYADGGNEATIRPSDVPPDAPRFGSYPASIYNGVNALPKLTADAQTRMYRTRIKAWSQVQPNFAGHYILATWGCGSECVQLAIIDAKTGTVFHPSGMTSSVADNVDEALMDGKPTWPNEGSIKFRADSALLIIFGAPEEDPQRRGISFYRWHNNKLSLIRFVPRAGYP